jgi:hypothetical protein
MFADPLTSDDPPEVLERFRACTGRTEWPAARSREVWYIVGRRGGKSLAAAKIGGVVAAFTDVTRHVAPAEQAVVMCLAADRRQARTMKRYILGLLESDPALRRLIVGIKRTFCDLSLLEERRYQKRIRGPKNPERINDPVH